MGYAQTLPLSFLEFGNAHTRLETTVSTVPSTWVLSPFSLVNYLVGRVHHAYLDVYFPYVRNSAAGVNYIVGSTIGVKKFGAAAYSNAIDIGDESMYLSAGSTWAKERYTGNHDIQLVVNDVINNATPTTMLVGWENVTSNADSLVFRDAYCILRVSE